MIINMTKLLQKTFISLIILIFSGFSAYTQKLTIEGHSFFLDGNLFDMWGVRVASASQNDTYTDDLISNLDHYKAVGINTISVFLQGSSGGYSEPFYDGGKQIEKDDWIRLTKIIDACAKRDIVVIAGIFYQRTMKDAAISKLQTELEIRNAVRTVAEKLKPYPNVIINIANEQNSSHYKEFKGFDFNNPVNIISLCQEVKKIDPTRIVGGGGYHDDLNVIIGRSDFVDVLLFDTFSGDIEKGQHSGWHYDYFREQGVPDKPMVNVELFGGWTRKFMPQGVYTEEGKQIHYQEIEAARIRPGLSVHLHSNPWFQGVAQELKNRFDLGGDGTTENPGVRWYFAKIGRLENPFTVEYLLKNLRKSQPRLVLNAVIEKNLREKLKSDPLIQNIYQSIKHNAAMVLAKELIKVDVSDDPRSQRNQLGISREFLWRMNMLAMVYRIEKDPYILERINDELVAACNFPTWNPRHFLDVGEMSLAISLALDWTAVDLPKSTIQLAKNSLIEKGIKPSWPENGKTPSWVYRDNNWNQVCNGGMIAASITVAEMEPELAAKTIHRSIDGLNNALGAYQPDGVYPEGAVYWGYGTQFSVVTAAMLESAFGTDFGIFDFPAFMESATFRLLSTAPSGKLFNYADCAEEPERYTDFTLSWFAAKTGDKIFMNEEKLKQPPEERGRISRLAGAGLVWTAQFEEKKSSTLSEAWAGSGANPIVVFTGGEQNTNQYYFGGKGGRGTVNHGNMDAGSFIFELNGVRWVVDPGNQSYGVLERAGFNLWSRAQESDRWKLITKSNFGHSTISVNNQLHNVDGLVSITDFKKGEKPEATFDMTPAFRGLVKSAKRTFKKDSPVSVLIEDEIEKSEKTELITWQLMTTAEVQLVDGGAILKKDDQELKIESLTHPDISMSVLALDPAPLKLDKQIEGLKRVELRIPAWSIDGEKTTIKVRLAGI